MTQKSRCTHVHVLSSLPSILGWQAILRPRQKKHARNGSFLGCFFPRLPRRDGDDLPSSSSPSSSESTPLPPRPSRYARGSVSGYVMNVRVCGTGVSGIGVDAGEGDCATPCELGTDEGRRWPPAALAATMSSGYGRWPIGDLARGGRPGDSVLGFDLAGVGAGATYWPCASGAGGDVATYGFRSSRATGGA